MPVNGQSVLPRSEHAAVPATPAKVPAETPLTKVLVTQVGLQLPERLAFDSWAKAGRRLSDIASSSSWCLGDWLVYGQQHYADRYREAIKLVGLDYQTLRNYAWVARAVEHSRRRPSLSFQHHSEVAPLLGEEQVYWLKRAEENNWSRNELRRQVRGMTAEKASRQPSRVRLRFEGVPADRISRWQAAAERTNTELDDWLISCADAAAARVLEA